MDGCKKELHEGYWTSEEGFTERWKRNSPVPKKNNLETLLLKKKRKPSNKNPPFCPDKESASCSQVETDKNKVFRSMKSSSTKRLIKAISF